MKELLLFIRIVVVDASVDVPKSNALSSLKREFLVHYMKKLSLPNETLNLGTEPVFEKRKKNISIITHNRFIQVLSHEN